LPPAPVTWRNKIPDPIILLTVVTGKKGISRGLTLMKKESKSIYLPIILILFSIFVSGKKLAVLPGLVNPFEFIIDADRIYIPDEASIFVYSLKDCTLIKKFGKEGEGPQEFFLNRAGGNNQVGIFFKDDRLLVSSFGRMSYFTKDGEYLQEIKIPGTVGRWFGALKDKFIGRKFSRMWTRLYAARKSLFVFPDFYPPIRRFYLDAGDKRIYVQSYYSTTGDNIEFLIFDFKGKLIKRVMMPFKIESRYKFYNGKIYQVMENEETEEYELHVLEIN
jgi:hypothetical protein